MLCVIPFHAGDVEAVKRLLRWIADLGGCAGHRCVLVADADTPWTDAHECRELAEHSFPIVHAITNDKGIDGWIPGSNSLFRAAAEYAQDQAEPFLFLEPDAVPLKAGWLDEIAKAYAAGAKPFMGSVVHHANPVWPNPYFEGVGVYPFDAWHRIKSHFRTDVSWTQACAPVVVELAENSPLFQHLWGELNNPPTFAEQRVVGTAIHDLGHIRPDAVVFHRNKDGTLIHWLRHARGIPEPDPTRRLLVVLPFCNKDVRQFMATLLWTATLERLAYSFDCLLSYENTCDPAYVAEMGSLAEKLFERVRKANYPPPPPGVWPPTWAFIRTAFCVQAIYRQPWLWWEYDMIPLKAGWISTLWREYEAAGRPFMGPIVAGQGHMNGTGIYPSDTPCRIPRAMQDLRAAWDVSMKNEMIGDCHNCGHLLQHAWVMDRRGHLQPNGGGREPSFRDHRAMEQLLPSAVVFHRCKDGSLIQRLRERIRQPVPA